MLLGYRTNQHPRCATSFTMKSVFLFLLLSILTAGNLQSQLVVDTVPDPQLMLETQFGDLVQSITNLTTKGNPDYWGIFDGSQSNIGLNSGIILTNGDCRLAMGVNDLLEVGIFDNTGLIGDDDLTAIAGGETEDASVLEFDFIAGTDSIFIHFVFASEEYPEWVANIIYNDVFAIWLDGENIALLPNGDPVCVNNVNCFGANSEVYVCSDPMNLDTTPCDDAFNCPLTIEETTHQYDGFNTPLYATIAVTPGSSHHLKMGIADVTDNGADSGVFLSIGSTTAIPEANAVKASINFYPNPTKGILNYTSGFNHATEFILSDTMGRQVTTFKVSPGTGSLHLPEAISKGMYYLTSADGVKAVRVVVE